MHFLPHNLQAPVHLVAQPEEQPVKVVADVFHGFRSFVLPIEVVQNEVYFIACIM